MLIETISILPIGDEDFTIYIRSNDKSWESKQSIKIHNIFKSISEKYSFSNPLILKNFNSNEDKLIFHFKFDLIVYCKHTKRIEAIDGFEPSDLPEEEVITARKLVNIASNIAPLV